MVQLVLWAAMLIGLCSGESASQMLVGSGVDSTQTHGWATYTNLSGEILLVHISPRDAGEAVGIAFEPAGLGELRAVRTLSKLPEGLAGIGDRVYLLFPPAYTGRGKIRRVFSARAVPGAMGTTWGFIPQGRLESEPAIDAQGELAAWVATERSLWALFTDQDGYTLSTLNDSQWQTVDLPNLGDDHLPKWTLSAIGTSLIAIDQADPQALSAYGFDRDTNDISDTRAWSPLDWARVPMPRGEYQILAGTRSLVLIDQPSDGLFRIRLWSGAGLFTIADGLELPADTRFTVLDSVNRLVGLAPGTDQIVSASDAENPPESEDNAANGTDGAGVVLYEIDLADGSVLYAGEPKPATPMGESEMRFLVGMMFLMMIGVLVVVIMPDRTDAMSLPDGFALADPGRRLVATLVDVFLVSSAMGAAFGVPVVDILTLNVVSNADNAWLVIPSVMVTGIVVMSLMEWLVGGSPGKFLVGVRVVRAQTGPMHRVPLWAAFVRNTIKWILPPVAAIALIDPEMLHRGDRATRTVVAYPIRPRDDDSASDSKD
jgi:uncharacterized RDD family membrane protein YckC